MPQNLTSDPSSGPGGDCAAAVDDAFEHFRICRREDGKLWELGRGSMGVTYKALDTNLESPVALKVINAVLIDRESARERFVREARAAASLHHRNVASVYHLANNSANFFYAMEFIDGETIEHLVTRAGPLPWRSALNVALQVTNALMAAYNKHLVHRDIKPANIMLVEEVGEDERIVKLIDFGLAKSLVEGDDAIFNTNTTGFLGTPLYASPEQCDDLPPDTRSDIYSLGVTVWYMLKGAPPFIGSRGKVFKQHLDSPPPFDQLPAELPDPVRALLGRMLAKERADRPQTPADLRREIDACLRQSPSPVDAPEPPAPLDDEKADETMVGATVVSNPPRVGQIYGGRYQLTQLVGEGASGKVFRAFDARQDGRVVAVKVLHPGPWLTAQAFYRLQGDIGRLRDAPHPRLIHPVCLERVHGYKYVVSEWIEGFSLADLLAGQEPLAVDGAVRLLMQALDAAEHCRAHGLRKLALGTHQILLVVSGVPAGDLAAARSRLRLPSSTWPQVSMMLDALTPQLPTVGNTAAGRQKPVKPWYVLALADLFLRMVGGTLPDAGASGEFVPSANLSEEANATLHSVWTDGSGFQTERDFCDTLFATCGLSSARVGGNEGVVRVRHPLATLPATSSPSPFQAAPAASARPVSRRESNRPVLTSPRQASAPKLGGQPTPAQAMAATPLEMVSQPPSNLSNPTDRLPKQPSVPSEEASSVVGHSDTEVDIPPSRASTNTTIDPSSGKPLSHWLGLAGFVVLLLGTTLVWSFVKSAGHTLAWIASSRQSGQKPPGSAASSLTLEAVRAAQAKAYLSKALDDAVGLTDAFDKARTFAEIAAAQAEGGDQEGSRQNFAVALSTARDMTNDFDKARALRGIADAKAQVGDIPAALSTARDIMKADYKVSALATIAVVQAKAGDQEGSRQNFAVALSTARDITGVLSRARTLAEVAVGQAKAGDVSAALSTAQDVSGAEDKASALGEIAAIQAQAGDISAALSTARDIPAVVSKTKALAGIAAAQARAGDQGSAESILSSIPRGFDKIRSYVTVAQALLKPAKVKRGPGA